MANNKRRISGIHHGNYTGIWIWAAWTVGCGAISNSTKIDIEQTWNIIRKDRRYSKLNWAHAAPLHSPRLHLSSDLCVSGPFLACLSPPMPACPSGPACPCYEWGETTCLSESPEPELSTGIRGLEAGCGYECGCGRRLLTQIGAPGTKLLGCDPLKKKSEMSFSNTIVCGLKDIKAC